jgi:hypothetical protein
MYGLRPSSIVRAYTGTDWLSLAEAKAHLRVDWNEDDLSISRLVDESTRIVESYLARPVRDQTITFEWGPVATAPLYLNAPYLEPGATFDSLTVSVDGATAEAQAYKANPFYDRALRELLIELEDTPSMDDEERGVFEAVFTVSAAADAQAAVRRARLLYIGEHHESRMGTATLSAMYAILDPFRLVAV